MAATGCLASPPCDNGDGRTEALCSQYINPFSVNEYVWGTLLGIEVSSPNVLMADRIEFWDDIDGCSEPQTTVATCCVSINGGIGVDCDGPETVLPPIEDPSYDLPEWWTVAFPCAVDVPERVLSDVIVSYSPSTAIPYECALSCEAQGYYFAGLEYGDECYCGKGYSGGIPPTAANVSDCSMRCAGDYFYACGGS
ncbi:hypothetical protein PHLCEN_2v12144 [Hermanssonia centrifuga]|uniref:WSC domain-containing protein n=1 Tax=Hermanssonia centrifuga TaxID=98765 RepID=A0A2R6NHS4_9APHY|nr:hypothetical protein PHLCEN_2v12144 [Hermanssonia centrifuga]